MGNSITELTDKIKILKRAKKILSDEYSKTDFHKKKEAHPQSTVPPSPEDEEIYKLLNAIRQIETQIKKFQDEQFDPVLPVKYGLRYGDLKT